MSAPDGIEAVAVRARDAALSAGAGDAEAFVEDSSGVEIRVYDGEVESLSESAARGVGLRAWLDGRTGYAYGTDLGDAGIGEVAAGAVETARISDPDEFAGPPDLKAAAMPTIAGIHDPSLAQWATEQKVELAQGIERACRATDERVAAIEQTVYADEEERVAIASSGGLEGAYASTTCYAYLQAIAGEDSERETGLGFGVARAPSGLDPEAIGVEAAERATSLLGATKPRSRTCPVVLDETVAASFMGFIGGVLCADAVQRGRSPFAGRLGDEIAAPALTLADDGTDPEGPASAPFDGEGTPRSRTPLIEAGALRTYLHDAHTARRGGEQTTGNAARHLRHRRRRPSLRRQPGLGHVLGRRLGPRDLRRCARRAAHRVHDRLRPRLDARRRAGRRARDALGAVRRLGQVDRAADRGDGGRGKLVPR